MLTAICFGFLTTDAICKFVKLVLAIAGLALMWSDCVSARLISVAVASARLRANVSLLTRPQV